MMKGEVKGLTLNGVLVRCPLVEHVSLRTGDRWLGHDEMFIPYNKVAL